MGEGGFAEDDVIFYNHFRVALNNGKLTTARTRTCINNYFYGAIHKTIISLEQRPSDLKL